MIGVSAGVFNPLWSIIGQLREKMASIQKRGDSYRVHIIHKGYPAQTNTPQTKAEAFKLAKFTETQIVQRRWLPC